MSAGRYDMIVIGGGAAGLTAVDFGLKLGAKVALIEKERPGGDCTWTGCVPSKALLRAAKVAHTARNAASYGILNAAPQVNMPQVRDYIQRAIADVYQHETPQKLRERGIDVIIGRARFLDAHRVQVGSQIVEAKYFVLATGAHPVIPAVAGIETTPFVTYEQVFDIEQLPQRFLILGAGPVGTELAQAYGRLGAQVTLVDVGLLPGDEPEVGPVLGRVLAREGVTFVKGLATAVSYENERIILIVEDEETSHTLEGHMLLVAVGRAPNVHGLDLEKAGVRYTEQGVTVDRRLATTARHIFAAGDCVGGYQFTHFAGWQAFTAVRNALLPGSAAGQVAVMPWTTFTDPEVAHVGLTEQAAKSQYGNKVQSRTLELALVDRAVVDDAQDGFIKIVKRADGRILGVTIVAARAGEMIAEVALAMQHDITLRGLADTIHPYPTYATGLQQLAVDAATDDFLESVIGRLAGRLSGLG